VSAASAVASACGVKPLGRPPTRPRACRRQPGLRALADQLALELGQRREQVEHEPPLGAGGVDGVVQAQQPDLALHQAAHQFNQVLERAPHAIQLPDHQHVAGPQLAQQLVERRPCGLRAARHILIDALAAGRLEGVHLQVCFLVARGNAGVADFHA